jgi:hypothetical protein
MQNCTKTLAEEEMDKKMAQHSELSHFITKYDAYLVPFSIAFSDLETGNLNRLVTYTSYKFFK